MLYIYIYKRSVENAKITVHLSIVSVHSVHVPLGNAVRTETELLTRAPIGCFAG